MKIILFKVISITTFISRDIDLWFIAISQYRFNMIQTFRYPDLLSETFK